MEPLFNVGDKFEKNNLQVKVVKIEPFNIGDVHHSYEYTVESKMDGNFRIVERSLKHYWKKI